MWMGREWIPTEAYHQLAIFPLQGTAILASCTQMEELIRHDSRPHLHKSSMRKWAQTNTLHSLTVYHPGISPRLPVSRLYMRQHSEVTGLLRDQVLYFNLKASMTHLVLAPHGDHMRETSSLLKDTFAIASFIASNHNQTALRLTDVRPIDLGKRP